MSTASERVPDRGVALACVGVGLVLCAIGCLQLASVESTPAEFSYFSRTLTPMPFAAMRGFTWEQALDHLYRVALLGPGVAFVGVGLAHWMPDRVPDERRVIAIATSVGFVLACASTFLLFGGRATTDDELTYAFQASALLDGRLGRPLLPDFAPEEFTLVTRVGLAGRYLFGEPLVQMPGVALGLPTLLHPFLHLLTLAASHRAALRFSDRPRVAAWTVALIALSPMVVLATGTGQSQTTSLACIAVACAGLAELRRDRPLAGALVMGLAIGLGMTVRPQAMAPAALVLVTYALPALWTRSRPAILALAAPLAIFGALIGAYDQALTGSPLTLPWSLVTPAEFYGFGHVSDSPTFDFGPMEALSNLAVNLVRWNTWWLGWPLGLGLIGGWLALRRPNAGSSVWIALALAQIAFQLGYYSPGVSDVGPIYWFELALPLSVLGAATIDRALETRPRATLAMIAAQFVIGTTLFYGAQTSRLDRLVNTLHADVDHALATIETPAIVFHDPVCPQSLWLGWIASGFPRRWRSPSDPIVTFALPPNASFDAYLRRYPDRACYYVARDQQTGIVEAQRCEAIEAAIRSDRLAVDHACVGVRPTAALEGD